MNGILIQKLLEHSCFWYGFIYRSYFIETYVNFQRIFNTYLAQCTGALGPNSLICIALYILSVMVPLRFDYLVIYLWLSISRKNVGFFSWYDNFPQHLFFSCLVSHARWLSGPILLMDALYYVSLAQLAGKLKQFH